MIKVLWLDDDFAPVNLNEDKGVQLRKKNLQDTAEDAVDYDIDYDPVIDLKEFVQKLETEETHYDAVILDILGLNPDDSTDETIMYKAIEYIKGYHGLLCYVFSNNTDSHKGFLETHLPGCYFEKRHSAELYNKIKEDVNSNNYYYINKEYLRVSIQNGWIERTVVNSFLDALMKTYVNTDIDCPHGNNMRNVVVPMLERIVEEYEKKDPANIGVLTKRGKNEPGRPSDIANNLPEMDPDSKHMAGALLHMIKANNKQSHEAIDDEERQILFDSDFSTFFLVCKWFYKKMCSFSAPKLNAETPSPKKQENIKETIQDTQVLQKKINNSIPVRVYKDNHNRYKLDLNIDLPYYLCKENPTYVYVTKIFPKPKNPSVWSVVIDASKPFDIEDDKPSESTYSLGDKLLEAFNKKK